VRKLLSSQHPQVFEPLIAQLSEQFEFLTGREFFLQTPWPWLQQYLRYCEAIQIRWNKAQQGGLARDSRLNEDVHRHWRRLLELDLQARRQHPQGWPFVPAPAIQNYRWLVEEYRVSVFAQQLKTAVPVSVKRLEEAWEKAREALG
jgi:ATP-dependent helicase HrpA